MHLDRDHFGVIHKLCKTGVWYSVEVDLPEPVVVGIDKLQADMIRVNTWLASLYEERRVGRSEIVEIPKEIMEILCPTQVAQERAVKQRRQGSAADSSIRSQSDLKNVE